MPVLTHAGPLGEIRSATIDGGLALTTTAKVLAIPKGAKHLFLTPRNFATAVVAKLAKNPYLAVLFTTDNLATATDHAVVAQDADTTTTLTLNSWDTAANTNYLYIGAPVPFRGVDVDVTNTNSNASVLTVKYWNGSAWVDITATDGTTSGGATFAIDGQVTWTVPAAWSASPLVTINSPAPGAGVVNQRDPFYWTRWQVSAALDSTVSVCALLSLNRLTGTAPSNYWQQLSGVTMEVAVTRGPHFDGCIEALVDAGTGNLIMDWTTGQGTYAP